MRGLPEKPATDHDPPGPRWWGWLIALGLLLRASPAGAEGFAFNVSPLLIELQGLPGSSQPFEISITNESVDRTADFTVTVVSIQQDRSGNYRVAESANSEHSAAGWIQVSPAQFTLPPGQAQSVRGVLTFPRRHRGGAYAGILLQLQPEARTSEGPAQVFRNEFLVVVEAVATAPGLRPDVYISNFRVLLARQKGLESVAWRYGPQALVFAAEVTNEGDVHAFASGSLSIWDSGGRKLRQVPLGAGRGVVLPSSTVQLVSILPGGLPPGEYGLQAVVHYGGLRPAITRQKFVVGETLAQEGQGGRGIRWLVEPETLSFELVPGASRFASVRIRNLDKLPITVTGRVLPLVYDAAGNPNLEEAKDEQSSASWTLLRPQSVTIPPGGTRNLQIGVRTPRDAQPGGHYAQVLLTARPEPSEGTSGLETELSVPVYALLGKDLPAEGELADLEVRESEDGRFLIVSTVFTNRGKIHVRPSAQVIMEMKTIPQATEGVEYVGDPIWVETTRLSVPPTTTPVLPGGVRNLGALIQKPEQPGEYRLRVYVRYGQGAALVQEASVTIPAVVAKGGREASPSSPKR